MKPKCKLAGEDGNIFSVMGRARIVLKREGLSEEADEMSSRVMKSGSYDEALAIVCEYVDPE